MTFSFHPEAKAEFDDAIAYYENQDSWLGIDFFFAVEDAIESILEFPRAWPQVYESARPCLVGRFPYGVVYTIESNGILIHAIMHLSRDPEYWVDRI
ncbi:MAG: type II toxin-antitoxin system RelE/ParE family toxin [Planctomycetes bacterium]|nr:type II toxin-antitoxin system RelE/ParE family toxin [Planctomycetota bacterium]